jgi:hypothetical protein
MRMVFGLIGLVIVMAIVAMLAKKQTGAISEIKVPAAQQGAPAPVAVDPNANVRQQSQQIQQQVKQAVEAGMQPRQIDEAK